MQNYKMFYFYSLDRIGPSLSGGMGCTSLLQCYLAPRGGVTFHLSVEEDVLIVLPNCNVVVPFKR